MLQHTSAQLEAEAGPPWHHRLFTACILQICHMSLHMLSHSHNSKGFHAGTIVQPTDVRSGTEHVVSLCSIKA